MSSLGRSYATYLDQFARSVDIVNDETWKELRRLVTKYVNEDLRMDYFEFVTEESIDVGSGQFLPGMKSLWTPEGMRTEAQRLLRSPKDGSYTSHSALVFETAKPMWIVGENGEPLADADKCLDLWSRQEPLPDYYAPVEGMRMSVLLPLKRHGRVVGVLNMESRRYRKPSQVGRTELERLAKALTNLHELYEAHTTQSRGTSSALEELTSILSSRRFPTRLSTPQLFFASSSRADPAVVEAVRSVLAGDFSEHFEMVHWSDIQEAGNITSQTLDSISMSRFGLCYLSEPTTPGAETAYGDNPNVIFEAGMLHAYTNTEVDEPRYWIPVREADSPPTPFDFAAQRTVVVPRDENGALLTDEFTETLTQRLEALIEAD